MPIPESHPDLKPGFAFHFDDRPGDDHLYFVASDVRQPEVVILSLTTMRRFSDASCVIHPGEHPFVIVPSSVSYAHAEIAAVSDLAHQIDTGDVVPREPLSTELMNRVWDGAAVTRNLPLKCQELLSDQGLI